MVNVKIKYLIVLLVAVIILSIVYVSITGLFVETSGQYDEFAKCLTEKGAVFYGSFQCPHCKTQKDLFGRSIEYVNYIECGPLSGPVNSVCTEAGIRAYPTWIINGIKYTGVLDLNKLSELTSCSLQ